MSTLVDPSPVHISADSWLVPHLLPAGPDTFMPVNSMVIRGEQPVIVDTGAPVHRETWLQKVFNLVEPEDVRWVFLSHDDSDHIGNLDQVMDACPNATIVANFFTCERVAGVAPLPLDRMRWLEPGEALDIGDRVLRAVLPPLFDAPTTRGLYDERTRVLWAADSFVCPTPGPVFTHGDVPAELWDEAFAPFNSMVAPWHALCDTDRFRQHVDQVERLPLSAVASGHGPILTGAAIDDAFRRVRALAGAPIIPPPGQALLEEILAGAAAAVA